MREREGPLVGWWGLALLVQAIGVCIATLASPANANELLALGTATIICSDALKWKAAREFAYREARLLWMLLGPVGFLLAVQMGYLDTFDSRLNTVCTILAIYNFAAAFEFAQGNGEELISRRPTIVLLIVVGLGYLSWLPLNFAMPIQESQAVLVSFWFPATILLTLLLRVALAFTVLSLAKERREFEQRIDALTDPLTGLANRRALFEAADAASQDGDVGGDALSVLIFDLDHFKEINDHFGHVLGDRVLKLFAGTTQSHLTAQTLLRVSVGRSSPPSCPAPIR